MTVDERVPLSSITTFKSGGLASRVIHIQSVDDLAEARELLGTQPFYPLGEGSNVLPSDDGYDGTILKFEIPGIEFEEAGDETRVICGAGVSWDALVTVAAERNLWGIENLAGIPGTVGAAPVQNIGAYGAELSHVLRSVDVYDMRDGSRTTLPASECGLAYRDSRFKHEKHLVIVRVTLALSKVGTPRIEYGDLLRARDAGQDLSSPAAIGAVVRSIRAGKFPDLSVFGTAGSFFKNPILTEEKYAELSLRYGTLPRFPNPSGVKVPLAFLLDKALTLRGFRMGNAHLFGAQPLVLVLDPGGTSSEIETLAREVESRVYDATGIRIEREVRSLPERA